MHGKVHANVANATYNPNNEPMEVGIQFRNGFLQYNFLSFLHFVPECVKLTGHADVCSQVCKIMSVTISAIGVVSNCKAIYLIDCHVLFVFSVFLLFRVIQMSISTRFSRKSQLFE